jgi:glycosyltransferase involved in cell wall biosynthesis
MRMAGIGGAENHLRQLIPGLRRHGWDSDLLIPAPRPSAVRALAHDLAGTCGTVRVVPMKRDIKPGLVADLIRVLRSGEYRIVNSHLVHADWYAAAASLAAPGIPLVSTKHNDDPFRRSLPFRLVEKATAERCATVIAISDSLRDFTLQWTGARTPVVTVHYGLEASPTVTHSEAGPPTLLTVARLVPQKGLDVLIKAMKIVTASVPTARLLIAGEGPERRSIEALTAALELDDAVSLLGHRNDVSELMRAAWVLVHPARWEGFGLVFLEAMREALPIIATRVGAVPEIVVDGVTGRVVPPEHPTALADAIVGMLADSSFRRSAGAGGLDRLIQHFSADRMARATVEVYDRALTLERR